VVEVADSVRQAGEYEVEEPATQVRQQSNQARWQRGQ
jgi:hypothetical protein